MCREMEKQSVNIRRVLATSMLGLAMLGSSACRPAPQKDEAAGRRRIIASDTLLSGMVEALLPPGRADVRAILPPAQCPGHYDVKLSDIQTIRTADLVLSMRGMPFMEKAAMHAGKRLFLDAGDRNWMAPPGYILGLGLLAAELSRRFPDDGEAIALRRETARRAIMKEAAALRAAIARSGIGSLPVLASSRQKGLLEWMGFRVAGSYGPPESMSAREMVRLSQLGKEQKIVMVVDNLQSGPEAGKGIAEALRVPHIVLSNFPLEEGYAATLASNVRIVLAAARVR